MADSRKSKTPDEENKNTDDKPKADDSTTKDVFSSFFSLGPPSSLFSPPPLNFTQPEEPKQSDIFVNNVLEKRIKDLSESPEISDKQLTVIYNILKDYLYRSDTPSNLQQIRESINKILDSEISISPPDKLEFKEPLELQNEIFLYAFSEAIKKYIELAKVTHLIDTSSFMKQLNYIANYIKGPGDDPENRPAFIKAKVMLEQEFKKQFPEKEKEFPDEFKKESKKTAKKTVHFADEETEENNKQKFRRKM